MTRFRPRLGKLLTTVVLQVGCAVALLCVTPWAPNAYAYPMYDNGSPSPGAGCVDCHNEFQSGTGALHQKHKEMFGLQTHCNNCHPSGGGSTPVYTFWSGNGFGCAGCHGRDYGQTSQTAPHSGQPKATAYGLRQVHANHGVTVCASCHVPGALGSPNPFPPVLPENVAPPYYNPAFSNLTNPCSSFQEDFDADSLGLDNDGNGFADYPADINCPPVDTPTPTATPTAAPTSPPFDCGSAPAGGCIAAGKAVLLVKEKKPGKEKLKVVLKKLQAAVAQSDFGDPVVGTTAYKVCIYDDADQPSGEYTVAQGGAICGDLSCWRTVSSKGYKYLDKSTSADGILKIKLLGKSFGKGKIVIVGKNATSTMPLGVAAALQGSTSATVQVLTSDASCFGASLGRVKKADGALFKALGP